MRIAIIDLGTNTFNLLVAELLASGKFKTLYSDKIAVKLGEGGINNNQIMPPAFERGMNAIAAHLATIDSFNVDVIEAFATSAIRNAKNGKEFAAAVQSKFKIEIQIIDGNREAELIYSGVKLGVQLNVSNSLIMDIGGGSTEFIIANSNGIVWKRSFELGAARLLEKFKPSDPIEANQINSISAYLLAELEDLKQAVTKFGIHELIGSSGSFDTFAEVISIRKNQPIDLKQQSSFDYSLDDFYEIHKLILSSTLEERLATPGIIPMRADMIVVSSIFTYCILDYFKIKKMRLSTYALKEGVLAKHMNLK